MNRRQFSRQLGLATAAAGLLDLHAAETKKPARTRSPKHWLWTGVDAHLTADAQKKRFDQWRAAGIRAVLFSGADDGVFKLARQHGLETHAWMWTLCRGDFCKDHPEYYDVSRLGASAADKPPYVDYYHFLCPSRTESQDFVAKNVHDLCRFEHLDGVHLDYVRYPDVILPIALWKKYNLVQNEELPPFDFCYCDVCRAAFKRAHGRDPLELKDPAADPDWRQYRYDSVTRLVNRAVDVAHAGGKKITAAVFPTPSMARKMVRQDWARWNLDAVLPMTYHSFYNEPVEWIEKAVREGVEALPADRPLYAGLYLPDIKNDAEFGRAVKAAMAGGAAGVSLFGGVRKIKT